MECYSCENSLLDFSYMIRQKEVLLEWLKKHDVILREKKCEKCGNICTLKSDFRYVCQKTITVESSNKIKKIRCNFSVSARKGTFFSKSNLSVETICNFVIFWAIMRPPRTVLIQKELKITPVTVVDWSSFCREICINWCFQNKVKIGGVGVTVEIDEAKIGKRKYNRGRLIEGKWIFGGFERGTKKMFVCAVENRSKDTLLNVIQDYILPGTTIISDCWKAYDCLQDEGYTHLKVNHSLNFVDPATGAHTQNIERCWREVRGNVPRYGRSDRHYEGYLCEFLWKRSVPDHLERMHEFFKIASSLYYPYENDSRGGRNAD